jgi:hypothetical protein
MAALWIARDKVDGSLWIFNEKPLRNGIEFRSPLSPDMGGLEVMVDSRLYPELTWENSPKELIVKED